MRAVRWTMLVCIVVIVASGCRPQLRVPPVAVQSFVVLEASREELLAKLEAMSAVIQTISADVIYGVSKVVQDGALDENERTDYGPYRGILIAERPSQIRMQADTNIPFSLVTAFDMYSDGEAFRLSIPAQGKFFYGANDAKIENANPLYNLRPHHVIQALFLDIRPYLNNPDFEHRREEITVGIQSYYIFSFIDNSNGTGRTVEKVWIDRRDLEVSRRQLFGEIGALEMDVQYALHQEADGVTYPQTIIVSRPLAGTSIQIDFQSATRFNVEIDPLVAFRLPFLSGAESIRVGEPEGDDAGGPESN